MKNKGSFAKGALCGALAMLLAAGGAAGAAYYFYEPAVKIIKEKAPVDRKTETKLEAIEDMIMEQYLYCDDIDKEALKEQLIKGYVDGLGDPYSVYYDKEETKELFETTTGEFGGIGVALTQDPESMEILFKEVYEGQPAEEAGFQEGDILYKVDGEDISGQELDDVIPKIKGEEDTEVTLTVFRGEEMEEVTATAIRKIIEIQTVEHEMKDNQIGYIQITEFDGVTYDQFKAALDDLQAQGMEGLVVDLRSNLGGSLSAVCDILDEILPEGMIVYTQDKNGKKEEYTSDEEHKLELPMAVLVDEYSASASEIFAGAVQDHGVATLVGTTTFGKGIVQQLFPMKDGTCLKLTISEYFTPNGKNIHGIGITPDVEIEYEYEYDEDGYDNQLEEALEVVDEKIAN